ncbi:MAG: hypothetical protein KJ648_07190 [Candidatus Omnitrophica bacterium]|nr:hypothetical protein [Candidatus Omnitrophota bacterium]
MAKSGKRKSCPVSKVKASFKLADKTYEVCAHGKRPVVMVLTDATLKRRTAGQRQAAIRSAKRAAEAAGEVISEWSLKKRLGFGKYRKARKGRRKARR